MHEAEMESANLGCPLAIWHMQVANSEYTFPKSHDPPRLDFNSRRDFIDLNKQKIRSLTVG